MIPDAIAEGFKLLTSAGLVEVTQELADAGDGHYRFRCLAPVPIPNAEGLPGAAEVEVSIPGAFPFVPVEVFPVDPAVRGFPHQDAETHKLCLREERHAPCDPSRLCTYVQWTVDWLASAAAGELLAPGDPYELPDFSRRELRPALPSKKSVWFAESEESLGLWKSHIGSTGTAEVVELGSPPVLLAVRFIAKDGSLIWQPRFSETFGGKPSPLCARWLLLPRITCFRHRPPQIYKELQQMLITGGAAQLEELYHELWLSRESNAKFSVLLVGTVIPRRVGEAPTEVHWQPLLLENGTAPTPDFHSKWAPVKQEQQWRRFVRRGGIDENKQLPWGTSTNVAEERLRSRGAVAGPLQTSKVMIVGCGALGSVFAELLVRMGARAVSLLDKDHCELGNLARHTLDGRSIGINKAVSLAMRLAPGAPFCTIRAFQVQIPQFETEDGRLALSALREAEVIIDCSANESAFEWLSQFGRRHGKRLAHIFISFDALFLTLAVSGRHTSCAKTLRAFYEKLRGGGLGMGAEELREYLREPSKEELVIPGAGCWHATFPARLNHIQTLTAIAFDVLEDILKRPPRCDGWAYVFRRGSFGGDAVQRRTIVEQTCFGMFR